MTNKYLLLYCMIGEYLNNILIKDKPKLLGFITNQSIMAQGTYISENLTQNQISFLLNDYEMDIFTLKELKQLVGDQFDDVNELVENLVHKKILSRIERGKYCCSNFRDEKIIDMPVLLMKKASVC